jgi:hypothetical protein
MFSASIVTLDERAAFIALLARRNGVRPQAVSGPEPGSEREIVMIRGSRIVRRTTGTPVAEVASPLGVNLGALAAAFTARLQLDGGIEISPEQAEQYASALQTQAPRSRRALYYLTREIFVTQAGQIEGFNRVFSETFGKPAGADRYREHATVLTAVV